MSPQDSQERVTEGSPTGSVDTKPKKMEKEPVSKVTSGAGKERLKAGAILQLDKVKKYSSRGHMQSHRCLVCGCCKNCDKRCS